MAQLEALAALSFRSLDDAALCASIAEIEQLGRYIDAARALAAAEVDERSRYSLGHDGLAQSLGFSRGSHLVEKLTRVPQGEAARRIRLGTTVAPRAGILGDVLPPEFPAVAASLIAGTMGLDAASTVITCLSQALKRHAPVDSVMVAEQALVDVAALEAADIVAVHARVWREALDPDGAEPRDAELRNRRSFRIGRERDGMTPFSGAADPLSAALLRAALAERPGALPRYMDPAGVDSEQLLEEGVPDSRTFEQRQFDVAFGLIAAGLRETEGQPGSLAPTSTVMAVITLSDLETGIGVGWLDGVTEPVSAATVQTLACDAGVTPIVLGSNGEVLHLGMTRRLFSKAQRRALAVRDGGCVWPQCTAPPNRCEAHHVIWWENGGRTDVDNGALLCSAHHHLLHASQFDMRMSRGRPQLLPPPWLSAEQALRPLGRARVLLAAG